MNHQKISMFNKICSSVFLLIVFLLVSLTGCKNSSQQIEGGKKEGKIISALIDSMATPFPLPPPPPKDGSQIEPINIDSLRKVKVEVVLDTISFNISKHINIEKEFSEYQSLIDSIPSLVTKPIEKRYVQSKKGHTIVFGNSIADSKVKYSQIISVSRIVFNQDKTKAALYGGYSTHPLASYLNLYLFEKKYDKWEIVLKKNIEKS
jgi:hypothetical protein